MNALELLKAVGEILWITKREDYEYTSRLKEIWAAMTVIIQTIDWKEEYNSNARAWLMMMFFIEKKWHTRVDHARNITRGEYDLDQWFSKCGNFSWRFSKTWVLGSQIVAANQKF